MILRRTESQFSHLSMDTGFQHDQRDRCVSLGQVQIFFSLVSAAARCKLQYADGALL